MDPAELFEYKFWFMILRDHVTFIADALCTDNTNVEYRSLTVFTSSNQLRSELDRLKTEGTRLLDRITNNPFTSLSDSASFSMVAQRYALSVNSIKKTILNLQLTGSINIALQPTFVNHMLNEMDQCLEIFNSIMKGQGVSIYPVDHYHNLWLLDIVGHLDTISAHLDPLEKSLKMNLKKERKKFHTMHDKAMEFIGYMRSGVTDFAALQRLTGASKQETLLYLNLLSELSVMLQNKQLLSTLTPLMLDHMMREQAYYLMKIGEDSEYDPTVYLVEA